MDGVTLGFTDRKHLEEVLEQKSASLEEADRRNDEFLATLGHELRNPLAPLRNASEIITLRASDAAVVARARSVIRRQVQQLSHLVDPLLEVPRSARSARCASTPRRSPSPTSSATRSRATRSR
jgi:signal transduction histidine kinase